MPSINRAEVSCPSISSSSILPTTVVSAPIGRIFRLLTIVLGAASLAACAQHSVVNQQSNFYAPTRQAAPERVRTVSIVRKRPVAVARAPFVPHERATGTKTASQGIASFYTEGTQTASGEKFDTNELTAAHPTLPFGTKLRVTNVNNGQSVTVRVNDRGPYVAGRVVDVSYSAARTLGMVGDGVAKVKLDVVE